MHEIVPAGLPQHNHLSRIRLGYFSSQRQTPV